MILLIALIVISLFILSTSVKHNHESFGLTAPTVFWINLDTNLERANHTKRLLHRYRFERTQRISAITPTSPEYKLSILEKPCKRNTDKDVSVILSHIKAMYHALYHDPQPENPYALIIEDDIRFMYTVNFTSLVVSAPATFGILQLTTSSPDAIQQLWTQFQQNKNNHGYWHQVNWKDTTKNKKEYLYWSAQAYIIQKSVIKKALDYIVSNISHPMSFKIVNSFFPSQCSFTAERPCVLANCLFADTYLYSMGKPSYVSSIPLVTGSKIGLNSTIHQVQVEFHKEGFSSIRKVYSVVRHCLTDCQDVSSTSKTEFDCSKCVVPSFVLKPLL